MMKKNGESRIRNRRGVALAFVALLVFVLLGMAALAVDMGMLYGARTEAQRVADASALAGAGAYLRSMDEATARATAIDYGTRNRIRGIPVEIRPGDVDVIPDSQKVRVRVFRTQQRENPIETIFARALGFNWINVAAMGAAQAFPAGAIDGSCLLPFALPDRWMKADGSWPTMYDNFNPPSDTYTPYPEADATGYSYPESVGYRMQIRGQQPQGADYHPGWWRQVWFWGTQVPGNNAVVNAIRNCVSDEPVPVALDDWYQTQPGNLSGPQINNAFTDVINRDPGAYWDDGCNCIKGSAYGPGGDGTGSPRVRPIALFDPRQPPVQGAFPVEITNFISVFVESSSFVNEPGGPGQPSVWVRFMGLSGIAPGEWTPDAGPLARVLRLVE